jgi:hypothetical protein
MDKQDDLGPQPLTGYDADVLAWSQQQAALLRAGRFAELDIEHLADEIEDVGRSEKRELASRMALLLAHLLKWQLQPERRGRSWDNTIRAQRKGITLHLKEVPSLKPLLTDPDWVTRMWGDATVLFAKETGLENYPEDCPWPVANVLTDGWLPPEPN